MIDNPRRRSTIIDHAASLRRRRRRHHHHHNNKITSLFITIISSVIVTLLLLLLTTTCDHGAVEAQRFVDSSSLRPSIILIVPQTFKVPTNPTISDEDDDQTSSRLQQYVAVINNAQNDRETQLLREQYKKLTLQIRDARTPITGQLFYEHTFDFFPPNQQHLLIPVSLDQVSATQEHIVAPKKSRAHQRHFHHAASPLSDDSNNDDQPGGAVTRPQQLIVSIRPYQLESGFGSDNIEIASSGPILVEPIPSRDGRRSFTIVQTDKPVYKPDEKVRIRGMVINEIFRPIVRDELRLQVKNPHKIVVEEIRFPRPINEPSSVSGSSVANTNHHHEPAKPLYLDHIFEFPPEPMLGTWSVHLLHNDPVANDTINFEVKEYMLPPFEIQFHTPQYILPSTQIINGQVIAKYHYGKPVQGKAQIKFGYRASMMSKPKFVARSSIKTVDPATGRVDYKINTTKIKDSEWFPSIAGSKFVIEATITEMTTGHRETAQDSSCTFLSMPYRISFEDSIEDFKPGLSQQLTVQLIEQQTQRPGPSGERLIARYYDQNNTLIGLVKEQNSDTNNNNNSKQPNELPPVLQDNLSPEAVTDALGRAVFNVGPVRDDITSIKVIVKLLNSTKTNETSKSIVEALERQANPNKWREFEHQHQGELAIGQHILSKHESQNGWISLMNKSRTHLNVGDEFVSDLLIRDAVVVPQKIFYLILARGHILAMDKLSQDGLVQFKITEPMMPSIRIVLFALTHDSIGLLSDSMRINVHENLDCGLRVKFMSTDSTDAAGDQVEQDRNRIYKPNERGLLNIEARQGDVVSLIGVDKAVYSLRNRTRLDSSRIIHRVKRLDAGCGFGGGRNNLDVFHNAGLLIFRDLASSGPTDSPLSFIGSSCMSLVNKLRYLEDTQMGYSKPMFQYLNQPRDLDSLPTGASASRKFGAGHYRHKREVEVQSVLGRYKDPLERSCCRLGTLEDLPQRRNCSVRARIVERYMRQAEFEACPRIYFDCCRAIFSEKLLLGSIVGRRGIEPLIEGRHLNTNLQQAAPHVSNDIVTLPNVGQLEMIEHDTLVRNDFRETWLFDLIEITNPNGTASHGVRLPHSITSWTVGAMSLNQNQPMCLMPKPLELITFQKIFIQLSMPYKVIQGEQIDLVANIFNYSPDSQDVLVYMYGLEDLCSEAEPGERSERKRIRVERHGSQTVLFPMIPLRTGKFPIKIIAVVLNSNHSDIVERHLNVVPRGKPVTDETTFSLDPMNHQRRSKRAIQTGNLVDEIDSARGVQRSKVRLAPTRDSEFIVPQTQECIVSAIGDKMGQTVQTSLLDVENLIRLPHGCGEQVMIYLGPTLYTTRYLSSVNKLTGDLRWRAIRYIQSGYKRILNFRKETGAFSAFARRDPSIWLTAFVAKMLCQTERTPFVADQVHVDRTVINLALKWLIEAQSEQSGTWVEMNPVYHREMLGGVLRENALTAFVTLTLNECIHHSPELVDEQFGGQQGPKSPAVTDPEISSRQASGETPHPQTNSGLDRLRVAVQRAEEALLLDRYKAVKEKNPYVLALAAYALSFSRPRDAALILNDLMLFAERSQSRNHLSWRGDYPIETAAYALQALIELAPILSTTVGQPVGGKPAWVPGADAISIANWLSSKRSYSGAFESTQDTVVALEALSKFAQLQSAPSGEAGNQLIMSSPLGRSDAPSLLCNITVNNRTRRSIEFGKDNAQILQTFKLDSFDFLDMANGEALDIVTSGTGLGTMSVKLKYNVFQEDDELCRFNIDSSIEEWRPKISMPSSSKQISSSAEDASINGPSADQAGTNQTASDSIDEDYFKTFDKSMLNELNLIDLNQNPADLMISKISSGQQQQQQQQAQQGQRQQQILRAPTLRLKRSSSSSSSSHEPPEPPALKVVQPEDESWSAKLVSTLKSKLPSWLVPKSSTTPSSSSSSSSPPATDSPITTARLTLSSFGPQMININPKTRSNTARRSTSSNQSPTVSGSSVGGGGNIPVDAHLNSLSKQLEVVGSNATSGGGGGNATMGGAIAGTGSPISSSSSSASRPIFVTDASRRLVLLLRVCVHHLSSRRDSEMAVIEIGVLSGFKPNEADLKEIINDVGTPAMKYELSADRSLVVIYMHYIPFSGPYCLQFRLVRDSLVYNLQSGYIRVYEYYSPTHACSSFYTPSRVADLIETNCDANGQVCKCATRSLCPATQKLKDLSEIHQVNATSARNHLVDLVCSERYDLVSLVRLKSVRHLETGKMFKLSVKVKSDLKGNLTKLIDLQRKQRSQQVVLARKPQHHLLDSPAGGAGDGTSDLEDESSLDYLGLSIDSSCVRDDNLLMHLAHPNQWKQGGELMILFGRSDRLEKRHFRVLAPPKSSPVGSAGGRYMMAQQQQGPRPKPTILFANSSNNSNQTLAGGSQPQDPPAPPLTFDDAQQLQYSLTLPLDKSSILHDITYQAKANDREAINNLVLWLELRSRHDRWACAASGSTA